MPIFKSQGIEFQIEVGDEIEVIGESCVGFGVVAARERILSYNPDTEVFRLQRIYLNPKVTNPLYNLNEKYHIQGKMMADGLFSKYIRISKLSPFRKNN